MSTSLFGTGLWGGIGGGGVPSVGIPLSQILIPALRIAGITILPGTTPSIDQYTELIPQVNRMMSSYNLDGHRVYSASIDSYPLVGGQKVYTIGPGADFDTTRPIFITCAVMMFPTNPVYRQPVRITLDESEWMQISVQDIPGAPAFILYYDGGLDDNGWGRIYLYPQPPTGYRLEISTVLQLKNNFTAISDVVLVPPGYEEMMVTNLAIRCATMYPHESVLSPDARDMAARALQSVIISNSKNPALQNEAAFINNKPAPRSSMTPFGWWLGPG